MRNMDNIKLDMIKFLMTMFNSCVKNKNGVKQFKYQVEELVKRNQIPLDVRNLIYNMYGIANTDIYKPNLQQNKLMQINYLMMYIDSLNTEVELMNFKKELEDGVYNGSILKSVYDIIVDIYDLNKLNNNNNNKVLVGMKNGVSSFKSSETSTMKSNNHNKPDKTLKMKVGVNQNIMSEVDLDIEKFKSEYLSEIYYKYPNPSYDGCSGSSAYLYVSLISAKEKPKDAVLCIKKKDYDDGCHVRYGYHEVPLEYYK